MLKVLELANKETLKCLQLFSTLFYTKLISNPTKWTPSLLKMSEAKRNHANVHRWTKEINIFDQTVHIYPINEEKSHWYLIVAIFPSVANSFQPYMAVLDSNGKHDQQFAVENIKSYLVEEIECKSNKTISTKCVKEMKTCYPNLPQQPDGSSCGFYIVYYLKQILRRLSDNVELSSIFDDTSSWFHQHILYNLRYDAAELIKDAAEVFTKEQRLGKLTLPDLQVFPTAAEDKAIKRNNAQKKNANTSEDVTKGIKKRTNAIDDAEISKKKPKISFQEYIQNIEDTQQDYTSLWSYGMDGND
jgi:Ulp1 family protease